MSSPMKAFVIGMLFTGIFIGGMSVGKYLLPEYNLIEPIKEPKIIEKIVEVPVEVGIIASLNQLEVRYWRLDRWSDNLYDLTIMIDDTFTTSINNVTMEELNLFIEQVKEVKNKLEELDLPIDIHVN